MAHGSSLESDSVAWLQPVLLGFGERTPRMCLGTVARLGCRAVNEITRRGGRLRMNVLTRGQKRNQKESSRDEDFPARMPHSNHCNSPHIPAVPAINLAGAKKQSVLQLRQGNSRVMRVSEDELGRELRQPVGTVHYAVDLSECAGVQVAVGVAEMNGIGSVERFGADLELPSLAHTEILGER